MATGGRQRSPELARPGTAAWRRGYARVTGLCGGVIAAPGRVRDVVEFGFGVAVMTEAAIV